MPRFKTFNIGTITLVCSQVLVAKDAQTLGKHGHHHYGPCQILTQWSRQERHISKTERLKKLRKAAARSTNYRNVIVHIYRSFAREDRAKALRILCHNFKNDRDLRKWLVEISSHQSATVVAFTLQSAPIPQSDTKRCYYGN